MNSDILKKRTYNFALSIIDILDDLPKSVTSDVMGKQLLKSATSIGANYRAACKAKSKADFINKIKIVEEEADETEYWINLMKDSNNFKKIDFNEVLKEAMELNKIFSASAKTAKSNQKNSNIKVVN
jgi:four helix bundle protein